MSLWGFQGGENTLSTWSSLSQFDDMVWNEFGENGGHVVPDPNASQTNWMANGDRCRRMSREGSFNGLTNRDSSTSRGGSDSCTETSESEQLDEDKNESKEEVPLQDMLSRGSWTDLGSVVDLPLESQPFVSDPLTVPQETEDISCSEDMKEQSVSMLSEDVQLYIGEEDGSMVTDPFSLTDVDSQSGGLDLFVNVNTASKAESLLDLGWANIGNLDDMDKLFRNNDASFEPVIAGSTDGLEWPSSSPHPVSDAATGMDFEKPISASQGKPAAIKVEGDTVEHKSGPVSCDESVGVRSSEKPQALGAFEDIRSDVPSTKVSSLQTSRPGQQPPPRRLEKTDVVHEAKSSQATRARLVTQEEDGGQSPLSSPDSEKVSLGQAHRARRHAVNRKRNEERFRRGASYRKLTPGPPYPAPHGDMMQLQTLPLLMPGQQPHLSAGPPPPGLQVFPPAPAAGLMGVPPHPFQMPQCVPYVEVGYPLPHMPMMQSCPTKPMSHVQYPQPMFVDMQRPRIQLQKPPHKHGHPVPSPLAPKVPLQPLSVEQQQQHPNRPSFDASCPPPTSSPSMTPQEKMEKLRWRQQMQARIAVEQQQQQLLASQHVDGIEPLMFQPQQQQTSAQVAPQPGSFLTESPEGRRKSLIEAEPRRAVSSRGAFPATVSIEDEEGSSLEGSVLCQLEMTISQLDISTRVHIRNALFRLARSAQKRRAAGGENGSSSQSSGERNSGSNAMESSTAGDSPSCRGSRATSMSEVEPETNRIDRSIAKLLFNKPEPQYLPGAMYIPESPSYPGFPQLPGGPVNTPWGWSSAAVPVNNCVGPPGAVHMPTSLPSGCKAEEISPLTPWSPPRLINDYRAPTVPPGQMDPRFGNRIPMSKSRDNLGGLTYVPAKNSERKQETSMSPAPSLQTESCSPPGHAVRTTYGSNSTASAAACHVMAKAQDLEYKGDGRSGTMGMVGDQPSLNTSPPFVPDRVSCRSNGNPGVEEGAHGGEFKSSNGSDQTFVEGEETACITKECVQHLASDQDEAKKLNQLPVLETLSFPPARLERASHPKEGFWKS